MVAVFTYGTLQVPEIFASVTGHTLVPLPARLHGYARYAIREQVYPGIVPESGASVSGRYYVGLDRRMIAALDAFEDTLYERRSVMVEVGDERLPAETYVIAERFRHWLDDRPWDLQTFVDHHLAGYLYTCRRQGKNNTK